VPKTMTKESGWKIRTGALTVLLILWGLFCFSGFTRAATGPSMSPQADGKARPCLDCHRLPNVETNAGVFASQIFCLECHGNKECTRTVGEEIVSLYVDLGLIEKTRHRYTACIQCHRDVARSPHLSEEGAQCVNCHAVHGEKGKQNAPHLRVQCQACHNVSKFVELDAATDQVRLSRRDYTGMPIALTDHTLQDVSQQEFCLRCHYQGNKVGAAVAVLPPKGFICILCHNAPLALGHPVFWIAFLVFLLGALLTVLFWFQGNVQGEGKSLHRKIALVSETVWQTIFSRAFYQIVKTILLDVLLQRRLLQESVKRWFFHSLIYLSILMRFGLSLFTYYAYRISPDSGLAVALINKNHGFVAFTNDLLGVFILAGIVCAAVNRFVVRPPHVATEIRDNLALAIIGVLVILGFLLEGARILMTEIPAHVAIYSFIGYPVAGLLSLAPLRWTTVYPYLWYGHAVVGALFIAYLPFGKMRHMFTTPLTLVLYHKAK
jgi:nitrate reductase gamma subunit